MKKYWIAFFLMIGIATASSQILKPVKWTFSTQVVDGQTVRVIASASVDKGWHVYALSLPENGPIPTRFSIAPSDLYTSTGNVVEKPKSKVQHDKTFGMEVGYFEGSFLLIQELKVKSSKSFTITGELEFMACNDQQCLAPETIEFSLAVALPVVADVKTPTNKEVQADTANALITDQSASVHVDSVAVDKLIPNTVSLPETESRSYWAIFWLAFAGGLAALLTPCVFPMIPMTVSFFTKHSKTKASGIRNALSYAASIIIIYVILGTVVTALFGADFLNELSTAAWFNVLFGLLLIVFAISFFGAFELVLPSKWVNAVDKGADKGGLFGSFFMATTLALVSFSCTGPIVGGLIVQAAREGGMAPVIGMLGFSSAIALPFAFFAAFPGYLNSLPKSGGWLNSVKVVLGFIELAFAMKFLSMADMILKLGWLPREMFLAIWIVIFGALGFYLIGKIRLPHDSVMERVPVPRFMLALITFVFTIYMIPGLWGAPVKLISGFPPPGRYAESPFGVGNDVPANSSSPSSTNDHAGMHYGPHGILMFHDYDLALAHAKKVNKPLMIDFTGDGCVNCRKMEDNVWFDPVVKQLLISDFVIVSLVVDDRDLLPDSLQFTSSTTGKRIKTVGQKWSDFQMSRYHRNSQPQYVILNHLEQELVPSRSYDLSVDAYVDWLKKGIEKF